MKKDLKNYLPAGKMAQMLGEKNKEFEAET